MSFFFTNTQGKEGPSLEDEITKNIANTICDLIERSSFIFIDKDGNAQKFLIGIELNKTCHI